MLTGPMLSDVLHSSSTPQQIPDCCRRLWIGPEKYVAYICCQKRLPTLFQEKHSQALFAVPTSSRVVMGRAGIWCGCRPLVPYPVKVVVGCLFPSTEVDIKCTGHIAGCTCIWCRKKSRVSTMRSGIFSLFLQCPSRSRAPIFMKNLDML